MADPTPGLIFPYTDLAPEQAGELASVARPIMIYLPAGMEPSPGLADPAGSGLVELVRPAADPAIEERLKPILKDLQRWAGELRDLRELAHLRGRAFMVEDEATPLSLASTIRSYGRSGEGPDLTPHLTLHLAAWLDRKRAEVRSASAGLRAQEEALERALGDGGVDPEEPGRGDFPPGADPLAIPEPGQDPLLRLRLGAWAELYRARPRKAGLWLTRPEVAALLAADLRERTGQGPREEAGLPGGPLQVAGDLKGWRFRGEDFMGLLGLTDLGGEEQVLVAELDLAPDIS